MDRKLFNELIDAFGHIYVLTMSNRPDRRALIEKQFIELGLLRYTVSVQWIDCRCFQQKR